ncbi:hypothetical protein [Candidatus Hamiltonella defensa]|uniref:hypothetical protein n=1 Tax=Candidatus Williamhamiltonella defendens TaxID=138072 RepID=UPI0005CA3358|nr:hypothetical protein [Candidatus Hamiltonella defensa]
MVATTGPLPLCINAATNTRSTSLEPSKISVTSVNNNKHQTMPGLRNTNQNEQESYENSDVDMRAPDISGCGKIPGVPMIMGGIAAIIFSLGAGIFPIGIFIGMVSIMIGLACCKAF